MKNLIIYLLILSSVNLFKSQIIEVKVVENKIHLSKDVGNIIRIFDEKGNSEDIDIKKLDIFNVGKPIVKSLVNYKLQTDTKFIFWKNGMEEKDENISPLYICKNENLFKKEDNCSNKIEKSTSEEQADYDVATQIPFPKLPFKEKTVQSESSAKIKSQKNSKARYVILDATADPNEKLNNILYKSIHTDKETINNLKEADALPVGGSVAVFVKNYNASDLESISVEILGKDYVYEKSILDMSKQIKEKTDKDVIKATGESTSELNNNLKDVLKTFSGYESLNLEELNVLEQYKAKLLAFYNKKFSEFSGENIETLSSILNWYPQYLLLTDIARSIPDKDQVGINIKIKNKRETSINSIPVGDLKTTGGIGFNLGGMLYVTNLKNNDVYTKPSESTGKVRAYMDSDDRTSVGVGMNGEIYFRTGYLLRPSINVGFFVPFDEDITPFAAIGPGISIASGNLKFSFSWGLSMGKINAIKKEYDNVEFDATGISNDSLSKKKWTFGNYFGIGLSFNISSNASTAK